MHKGLLLTHLIGKGGEIYRNGGLAPSLRGKKRRSLSVRKGEGGGERVEEEEGAAQEVQWRAQAEGKGAI